MSPSAFDEPQGRGTFAREATLPRHPINGVMELAARAGNFMFDLTSCFLVDQLSVK
jgi:hypothetical protein